MYRRDKRMYHPTDSQDYSPRVQRSQHIDHASSWVRKTDSVEEPATDRLPGLNELFPFKSELPSFQQLLTSVSSFLPSFQEPFPSTPKFVPESSLHSPTASLRPIKPKPTTIQRTESTTSSIKTTNDHSEAMPLSTHTQQSNIHTTDKGKSRPGVRRSRKARELDWHDVSEDYPKIKTQSEPRFFAQTPPVISPKKPGSNIVFHAVFTTKQ